MNVTEYIQKIQTLKDNIPDIVRNIIYDKEIEIINLNREEQIYKDGIDVQGNILGLYANNKKGTGKGFPKNKNQRYNLFNEGNLYESFDITTNGFKLKITNRDSKVNVLQVLVGDFIGLTKENQYDFNYKIILPELQKIIKEKI